MKRKGDSGFTLIEVTIILLVLVVLANILLPVVQDYVNRARHVRCKEDIAALGSVMAMFISDNAEIFWQVANSGARTPPDRDHGNTVHLLIGDGDTAPQVSGDPIWENPYDGGEVDFFSHHLVTNNPGGLPWNRYRNPSDVGQMGGPTLSAGEINFSRDDDSGFNAKFSWRGAYITAPIDPDPWGNRYMSNVLFLHAQPTNVFPDFTPPPGSIVPQDYERFDVFVLCSGPDEETDTKFAQDGAVQGDDDEIYVVSGNAT